MFINPTTRVQLVVEHGLARLGIRQSKTSVVEIVEITNRCRLRGRLGIYIQKYRLQPEVGLAVGFLKICSSRCYVI